MALDGLLTSLRSKARGIGLSFYLAATSLLVTACGEKSQEDNQPPITAEQTNDCTTDRDCEPNEACMDGSCKSVDVGQYILEGLVTDWTTGSPVDGVEVIIKGERINIKKDTTDARGHYQVPQLSEGTYAVTWGREDYLPNTKDVHLLGADKTFDVELAPEHEKLQYSMEIFTERYNRTLTDSDSAYASGIIHTPPSFFVKLNAPEFIQSYMRTVRSFDGILLMFTNEARSLQVSENQLVTVEPYSGRQGRNRPDEVDMWYSESERFSAQARIPIEQYRFRTWEHSEGSNTRGGFLFLAKAFDLQEPFRFKCPNASNGQIDYWNETDESIREQYRQYCQIEEHQREDFEWANCLSEDCTTTFKIGMIDIYVYNNVGESY